MRLPFQTFPSCWTVSLILVVTGCGPMYDTAIDLDPPESASGQACVGVCETARVQCAQLEEMRAERCTNKQEWDKERCERDIWRTKNREPKWYECSFGSCSVDETKCENQFHQCYERCGGKVRKTQRCVMNCGPSK